MTTGVGIPPMSKIVAQLKLCINCEFEVSIRSTYKVEVIHIKFTKIYKIQNESPMFIFPYLSIHYTITTGK